MKALIKRKNIRLEKYDYSQEGYYFITICTKDKKCILSKIEKCRGEHCSPVLTKEGKKVEEYLKNIEKIYPNTLIEDYIIMPNHIHMLLIINEKEKNTISKIIQQYKGIVTEELKYSI